MIGLINYGSGNIHAIANVYKRLNIPFVISSDIKVLRTSDKLILPGVGDFDETMNLLEQLNLVDGLSELVKLNKKPILGVCVGMQILGDSSEEGEKHGLGWISGSVQKINSEFLTKKPHLPHLGWNSVQTNYSSPLFKNVDCEMGFYFLHSYHFVCSNTSNQIASTRYGEAISAAIQSENVYGVQFHPEKSHSNGVKLLENFARLC